MIPGFKEQHRSRRDAQRRTPKINVLVGGKARSGKRDPYADAIRKRLNK